LLELETISLRHTEWICRHDPRTCFFPFAIEELEGVIAKRHRAECLGQSNTEARIVNRRKEPVSISGHFRMTDRTVHSEFLPLPFPDRGQNLLIPIP
jgi:hypothetical protein